MLNALMLGTSVPIHRYSNSNENAILICGKLVEIIYDNDGNEKDRIHLNSTVGSFGCVVPTGAWHTVEVIEPSVIYEAKDGKYGEEGSETLDEYRAKLTGKTTDNKSFSNSLGDLKKKHRVSHWYGTSIWFNGCNSPFIRFSYAQCSHSKM